MVASLDNSIWLSTKNSEGSLYICVWLLGRDNVSILVKKKFRKIEKEYRDCIKRKWRQDWDMNETL